MSVGVVWFNAMGGAHLGRARMAGWGPNSVLSLVGGYRFVAQWLAYELPLMFALISAAAGAQSLHLWLNHRLDPGSPRLELRHRGDIARVASWDRLDTNEMKKRTNTDLGYQHKRQTCQLTPHCWFDY